MTLANATFLGMTTPQNRTPGPEPLWVVVLVWIVIPLLFCALIWKLHRDNVRRKHSGHDGGVSIASADSGGPDSTQVDHESLHQEGGNSGHIDCGLNELPA